MPQGRNDDTMVENIACASCNKTFATKKQLTVHQYLQHAVKHDCTVCNKSFKSDESLKRHHAVHDTDNRSKGAKVCKICKETFHLVRNLVEHHHAVHVQHKFFRCTVCNKQFSWRDNLEKHMSMHKEPHHTCIKCGRGFWDATSLQAHLRSYHQDREITGNKPYSCEVCGRSFEFDFTFMAHLKSHEGHAVSKTSLQPKKPSTTRTPPSSRNKIVASDGKHKIVVEILQPNNSKVDKSSNAHQSTSPAKRRKYEKYTPTVANLVMSKDKPFMCEICHESFRWEISLKIHMQQHEDDELEVGMKGLRKERKTYTKRNEKNSRIVAPNASDDEHQDDEDDIHEEEEEEEREKEDEFVEVEGEDNEEREEETATTSPEKRLAPQEYLPDHPNMEVISTDSPHSSMHEKSAEIEFVMSGSPVQEKEMPVINEPLTSKEQRSVAVETEAMLDPKYPLLIHLHLKWQQILGQVRRAMICKLCPYVASTPALMRRHCLGHLASYFMYPCNKCGEGFPFQRDLVLHKLLHQASKRHQCHKCGKCFSHRLHFIRHKKLHSSSSNLKHLKCFKCCRQFVRENLLEEHVKRHELLSQMWKCMTCQNQLDGPWTFEQHKTHGCIFSAFMQ